MSPSSRLDGRVLRGATGHSLERAVVAARREEIVVAPPVEEAIPENTTETLREAAYAEGYAVALADSATELELERLEQQAALGERIVEALREISANRSLLLEGILTEAGELIFELVRELVGAELELREDPTRTAIQRALRIAPREADIVVRLHPSAAISAWELESLAPGQRVRVVEDATVEEGGCLLEVGPTTIDGQIAPALERLRAALGHLHSTEILQAAQ